MFGSIVRALTGRGGNALPEHVQSAIDAARFMPRSSDEEQGPRVAVTLAGGGLRGAFIFDRETAEKRVLTRWPELTPEQVRRCVDGLEAGVMRASRLDAPTQRKNWVTKYSE